LIGSSTPGSDRISKHQVPAADTTALLALLRRLFGMRCREHGIEHRCTKINYPWTNGQVERMNRTIKEATVQRYHYDSHRQLEHHLNDFVDAYNFGRRLKTLKGLTPYEFICKAWTSQPERFILNPLRQMPGLNTLGMDWQHNVGIYHT
jgi:hypothetical protein